MNGTLSSAKELTAAILDGLDNAAADVAVCVPFVHLPATAAQTANTSLALGAQNVADRASGAYTGEVSGAMLKDFGCKYAIVGHSERRSYYGDSNESVAARFEQALATGIAPILCIGETLQEREEGRTFRVLDAQLDAVIAKTGIEAFVGAVVAYEPVWAIGTGKTASDEQAQEAHRYIREKLAALNPQIAENLQILYGGSVKADNALGLFAMPDIDGGLIGGASLDAASFLSIYRSAGK
jgi:triosephosphate isomerase